jgi:5-formaminoimidazole-4-carboxamide-1-beta-D-ribofuranosyl 5'-monophosphate synthetase
METIEEILMEAHAYGMRAQVLAAASKLMVYTKYNNIVDAYQLAFNQIITEQEELIDQ